MAGKRPDGRHPRKGVRERIRRPERRLFRSDTPHSTHPAPPMEQSNLRIDGDTPVNPAPTTSVPFALSSRSPRSPNELSSRQSVATRDPQLHLGVQGGDTSESATMRPQYQIVRKTCTA
jgi:hypothetical protein